MKTKLIFLALVVLFEGYIFGQNEFEIAATAMTLTRLSVKAQQDKDASSLIVYQNAWLELKEDYPEMVGNPTFIQTEQFFDQVNNAYASSVGTISYNMDGINDVVMPDASGGDIAVIDAPLGWSYSWQMPDCDEAFGSGQIRIQDVQVMKAVLGAQSDDPIELDSDQINAVTNYYKQLGNVIFKNKRSNTFTNVDAFTSKDVQKLKKYRQAQKETQKFKALQQLELAKPDTTNDADRIRSRQLNRIRTSLQRVDGGLVNDGGRR
ncbi:MAG: hypothetical protein ABJM06_08935 [Gilvibacter sp.]